MAERSVSLKLQADVQGFVNGLKTGAKALDDLTSGAKKFGPAATAQSKAAEAAFLKAGQAAHAAAAKHGLLYDANGKLQDAFGRTVSQAQAAKLGLKDVSDEARFASERATELADAWQTAGQSLMVGGGAVLAGTALAVKGFADFDKQMSSVEAATHETEANMASLRQAAIDAGADTAFSAAEAAQGIEEMAKAGVSTKDILGGGLNGALSLAAAGAIGVGEASETAASAMTQFGLSGEDIPHIADLLAAGAGKAQGSVSDMGAALNQSGLIAAQTGLTIEETTGGLAAFASAGLVGSDAGTSFKTMLQAVTPNSEKAAKAMDELGISAYDSQGNFIGLSEYAGVLKSSLSDMTDEQRNSTLETIFGSDAVRAAAVLYEQGAEGVQKWEDAVNDAGYAAETAAIMQDNLAGDIEKLGGSLDSVFLKSGSGANEVLRGLAQGAEGFIDAVGEIPEPVLNIGLILAGIAGSGALAAGGIMTVLPKLLETRDAFDALAPSGGKARGVIAGAGKTAGVAAVGFAALATAAAAASDATDAERSKTTVEEFANALSGIADNGPAAREALDAVFEGVTTGNTEAGFTAVNDLESALRRLYDAQPSDSINDFLGTWLPGVKSGSEATREAIANLDGAVAELATGGDFDDAAASFQEAFELAGQLKIPYTELIDLFPQYRDAITEAATANGITQLSQEDLLNAMLGTGPAALGAADGAAAAKDPIADVGTAAEQAAKQADDLVDSLLAMNNVNLSASDAQLGFDQAIADAAANWENAGHGVDYLNEKTGEFNQTAADNLEMLNGIASQGNSTAQAIYDQTGSYDQFRESLQGSRDALFEVAKAYYPTEEAAWAYVDSVLAIPPEMKTKVDISDDGSIDGIKANLSLLAEAINGTPDKTVIIDEPMSPAIRSKLEELGYVVETLPDGTIQVSQTGAAPTQAQIEGVANKPYNATVNANAETGAAEAELNHTARDRSSTVTQTVLKTEHTRYTGATALDRLGGDKANGGRLPGRADGGRLPATGLGTDKILGVNSDGVPLAWVDDREWVINRRSSDEYNRELAMINAGTFPKLAGFAAGGRLAWARNQQDWAWRQWDRLRDSKPRETDKNRAQVQRHEDRIRKAREEYEERRDRTQRLLDDERELKTDLRRGDIRDSVMSGSGLSVVDRLFDESRNTDLSGWQRTNLSRTASSAERQLLSLEKRSESLASRLETAKGRYDDLMQVRESVGNGIRSETSLDGLIAEHDATRYGRTTVKGVAGLARSKAADIRNFVGKLNKLRTKGYAAAIIQEVAEMGTEEGGRAADLLLSGSRGDIKALNSAYESVAYYSDQVGNSVTMAMYRGGSNAALGLVEGLESQQKAIEGQMLKIAKGMENALKRALGIRSPSTKARDWMHFVGDGAVLGLEDSQPAVEKAMAAMVGIPSGSFGSWDIARVPPRAPAAPPVLTDTPPQVVYVQNPWGPDYMQAKVDDRVNAGLGNVARKVGGQRR